MKDNRNASKISMEVGDRILIDLVPGQEVMVIARAEIPHSHNLAFATRSGGRYTIGRKIWKSDYQWDREVKMWVRKT